MSPLTQGLRYRAACNEDGVSCSGSSMTEAALSEPGSAPRLDADRCVGGAETRLTVGTRDCLNSVLWADEHRLWPITNHLQ